MRAEIPLEDVVVGDVVHLSAGDMIPADVRILTARDLFVSQSALTGESEPVEKTGGPVQERLCDRRGGGGGRRHHAGHAGPGTGRKAAQDHL